MITTRTLLFAFAATVSAIAVGNVFATHDHDAMGQGSMTAPAPDQDAWLVKAKATYPLDTCVVSGDKLEGDMGAPIEFIYKEDGKPDRLVRFCCKNCIKDFKKSPAQYLKKIDDAAMAKGSAGSGHMGAMH